MSILIRVLLIVGVLFLAQGVWAQAHYAVLTVEVPVDASVETDLIVSPEIIVAEALRPGDQAAYDVTVENRGTVTCKDVFPTQREISPYLSVQTWPTERLAPMGSATVRVVLTVSEEAESGTTLTLRLGLICVR